MGILEHQGEGLTSQSVGLSRLATWPTSRLDSIGLFAVSGSSCHHPIDSGVSELNMPHPSSGRDGVDVIFDGGGTHRPKCLRRAFFLLQLITLETSGNLYAAPR